MPETTLFDLPAFERHFKAALDFHGRTIPLPLRESMLYSTHSGGKRIRPRMLISIGKILGVSEAILLSLASAVEVIHTYTLIHDDLPCMDNDDFRRGKPTNHKVYGEGTALLAGDALMALAIDLLLDLTGKADSGALLDAIRITSHAMGGKGVIAGQVEEKLLFTEPSLENLLEVFRKKTGALFALAYTLPAFFTDLDVSSRNLLTAAGENLGIAFQIADDLEDAKVPSPPNIHIRAYLSDADAVSCIESLKAKTHTHSAIQSFTDSLFQDILEKCLRARAP